MSRMPCAWYLPTSAAWRNRRVMGQLPLRCALRCSPWERPCVSCAGLHHSDSPARPPRMGPDLHVAARLNPRQDPDYIGGFGTTLSENIGALGPPLSENDP